MSSVSLDNVRVFHGETLALAVDELEIPDGELLVLLGPSGSGKTTLLRAIAGLDETAEGTIRFGGDDVTKLETAKRSIAMVFQDNTLFPFLDVHDNVAFPLKIRQTPREEIASRVEAEARVLDIAHLLSRMPQQLGAGHQQLVQAARSLVRVPRVFLMDEPLARLDTHLRLLMRQEFRLLQQGYGVTTVFVTNDQDEAMAIADSIAILDQGRILQVGRPMEVYSWPATRFVAQFVGSPPMGLVPGRVTADATGFWLTVGDFRIRAWTPTLAEAPGGRVEVGVRSEDVIVDPAGVPVSVGRGYYAGSHGFAKVNLTGAQGAGVEMRTPGVPPPPGSAVTVKLRRLHIFDPDTGRVLGRVEDGAG